MCCCILIFIEFFHEIAATKCNKKWEDGGIEKLIDLYEGNSCLWDTFDESFQKQDVKEKALAAIAKEFDKEFDRNSMIAFLWRNTWLDGS